MRAVAAYSPKGGVGKSTVAANLAWSGARAGLRTLLADLDPQGASSFLFRVRAGSGAKASKLLEGGERLDAAIRESDHERLDVLPAHLSFRKLDLLLDGKKDRRSRLADALAPLAARYDLIVFDAPPSLALLAENLFEASDMLLVPVVPTPLAARTWDGLLDFFGAHELPARKLRPFFSMVESRSRLHTETMQQLRARGRFFESVIPRSADIERMAERREPIGAFAASRPGGRACRGLCAEILVALEGA